MDVIIEKKRSYILLTTYCQTKSNAMFGTAHWNPRPAHSESYFWKTKKNLGGLDRGRSRHPERLFGRPDMFLMRTVLDHLYEWFTYMTYPEISKRSKRFTYMTYFWAAKPPRWITYMTDFFDDFVRISTFFGTEAKIGARSAPIFWG